MLKNCVRTLVSLWTGRTERSAPHPEAPHPPPQPSSLLLLTPSLTRVLFTEHSHRGKNQVVPFSQGSAFLLFNTVHVFSISVERRLSDLPKPSLPRCQRGHRKSTQATAAMASARQGRQFLENIKKVVSIKTEPKTGFLISFPAEDILS